MSERIKISTGNSTDFENLTNKEPNCIYTVIDDINSKGKIFVGEIPMNDPIKHISITNEYGVGSEEYYGHVQLSDSIDSTSTTESGIAATPKAVSDALSSAKAYTDNSGSGIIYTTKEEYDALVTSGDVDEDKYYSYGSYEDGESFNVSQTTGTSTTTVMSQNATTLAIANAQLGDGIELVQETGDSTTAVMSQSAVTNFVTGRINCKNAVTKSGVLWSSTDTYNGTDYLMLQDFSDIYLTDCYEGPSTISACNFYDDDFNFISYYTDSVYDLKDMVIPKESIPSNTKYIIVSSLTSKTLGISCDGITSITGIQSNLKYLAEQTKSDTHTDDSSIDTDNLIKASKWEMMSDYREQQLRQDYLDNDESEHWYGVEYIEEEDYNNVYPIYSDGDESLHTTLPIQSKMKRCVTKNNIVQYYLDSSNSYLKTNGESANLDGTDGNVMVEIPEFFFKCSTYINSDNKKVVSLKISEQGLPDFKYSRKSYTSAFEATVNRDTNKLSSVCTTVFDYATENVTIVNESSYILSSSGYSLGNQKTATRLGFTDNATTYRGGINDSSLDQYTTDTNINYSRNQLGIPISNINRTDAREYCDNEGYYDTFLHLYDNHKKLWILAQIEFKTRNIQDSFEDGGMGKGATVYPDYNSFEAFFSPQGGISCIPCGTTNCLGNSTGEVYFKLKNVPVSSTGSGDSIVYNEYNDVWIPCLSYRGVEHFYGHLYKIVDQITCKCTTTDDYLDGYEDEFYYKINKIEYGYDKNPYMVSDTIDDSNTLGEYEFPSIIMNISELMLGDDAHTLPINSYNKDYYTNYCDCVEMYSYDSSKYMYPAFNGRLVSGKLVGFHFIVSFYNVDGSESPRPSDGTRLDHF